MTESADLYLPPRNTTTAVFHYLHQAGEPIQLDKTFTVKGIRLGKWMGKWVKDLLAEHSCDTLDATVEVWHHHPSGEFTSTEITHCPK